MNQHEIRVLLGEISAIDNRKMSTQTTEVWLELLANKTLAECQEAVRAFRRTRPDTWLQPGHIVEVLNRAGTQGPTCPHGIPDRQDCHDCDQPEGELVDDYPGLGQSQADLIAGIELGSGTWATRAQPSEVMRLRRKFRADVSIVYPSERHCLEGHTQADYKARAGSEGRSCGHPSHHPDSTVDDDYTDPEEYPF